MELADLVEIYQSRLNGYNIYISELHELRGRVLAPTQDSGELEYLLSKIILLEAFPKLIIQLIENGYSLDDIIISYDKEAIIRVEKPNEPAIVRYITTSETEATPERPSKTIGIIYTNIENETDGVCVLDEHLFEALACHFVNPQMAQLLCANNGYS